eukprot:8684864-Lingulodinium_polyedra.AAC.1
MRALRARSEVSETEADLHQLAKLGDGRCRPTLTLTRFLSSAPEVLRALRRTRQHGRKHQQVGKGRARVAA